MAKIKTMRMSGRRFGWKVGNSQIAVKEYFDVAEKLQEKIVELEEQKEANERFVAANETIHSDRIQYNEGILKALSRRYKRLRAVEARTWTPMESFIIDRPSEDEVNLETFVRGHILSRMEVSDDESRIRERDQVVVQAVGQGADHQ